MLKTGNLLSLEKIINENTGLVWSVVKRFVGRGCEVEDLFQIGMVGFIKAIKRFDLSKDNQLSTYAVTMIVGEIKRFLRDDGMIKVSRALKEMCKKAKEIKEYHLKQYGVSLSLENLADMLNITKEDLSFALESAKMIESLDRPIDEDNGDFSLYQKISDENNDYDRLLNKMTIEKALKVLECEERKIIIYRYFREMTQSSIAEILSISQVQVSRIEKRAMQKMRMVVVENLE